MDAAVVDAGSKLLKFNHASSEIGPEIIPTQMKRVPEDESLTDASLLENVTVDPVVRGFIRDWDAMEDLLRHVLYTGLGWEIGNEGHILFTDPLSTPKGASQAALLILAMARWVCVAEAVFPVTSIVYSLPVLTLAMASFDYLITYIASVIEGAVQHISSRRFEIGGLDLTNLFAQELRKSNPHVNLTISDVEKLKERYACCAEDDAAYEKIQQACSEEQHILPDGQVWLYSIALEENIVSGCACFGTRLCASMHLFLELKFLGIVILDVLRVIKIGRERYTVGEALFKPSILRLEAHGIVEQLVRCISTVSSENHRQLLENTVLCGGTASMTGFEDRFQKEATLSSSAIRPCLVKPPEYMPDNLANYSAWVGGAILAKVVFPQNQHVTKADYDETGPSIVHKKCF
ncbi:hypothetical protein DH2020_004977 [Rehmannia glutinosa]|uniref:Actin-related protein n=1 Tax=Rehmannia glutinosa TaxID=99300 RepID=A0ABR0XRA0_REHGL